jgi:hypothetical protein
LSTGKARRHLNESAAAAAWWRRSWRIGRTGQKKADKAGSSNDLPAVSQDDASSALNVSVPTIKRAKVVLNNGSAALKKAVESGKINVTAGSDHPAANGGE